MNSKYLILFVICFCVRNACSGRVQTTHGPVEGDTVNLFNGKSVDAFLGIPYAAPPIEENRFALPQPLKPWSETLYATSFSDSCLQAVNEELRTTFSLVSSSNESEDCLYLNVWRPTRNTTEKLAIMIWIYGGALIAGSTTLPNYNGEILAAEKDVIVVSMNYRLSAFGFLFLNSTEAPGNAGLQDQIKAIKWIKDNAEAFGGDPESITLFGHSVGSVAVAAHLTNPNLDDLFQRAIMMSGPIELITLSITEALTYSLQLAEKLGCPVDSAQQTLDCLRSKPVTDFFNNQQGIPPYIKIPYSIVRNGVESPVDPIHAAQNVSPSKRKDLMGGNIAGDEINVAIASFFSGKVFNEDFTVTEDELRQLLGIVFQLDDKRLQGILLHEYGIDSEVYGKDHFPKETSSLLSDFAVICSQINFMEEWITSNNRVYYYDFGHRPSKPVRVPMPGWIGTTHGDEIAFVFGLPLDPKMGYTPTEMELSKKMMTYWSNFAKTGDPNCNTPEEINWPILGQKPNLTYLRFNESITLSHSLKEKECAFWREILPSLASIQGELKKQ